MFKSLCCIPLQSQKIYLLPLKIMFNRCLKLLFGLMDKHWHPLPNKYPYVSWLYHWIADDAVCTDRYTWYSNYLEHVVLYYEKHILNVFCEVISTGHNITFHASSQFYIDRYCSHGRNHYNSQKALSPRKQVLNTISIIDYCYK